MIDSFKKSASMEMPYISWHDQELNETINDINIRTTKLLKEVFKHIKKDKKQHGNTKREQIQSEGLLDEVGLSIEEAKFEKILIVYEIHNRYLDEINRYKERKDNQKTILSKPKQNETKKVGSIITRLLQNERNSRLQDMLSRYKNKPDTYIPIHEINNEDEDKEDFLIENQRLIEENGITVRSFCILDQVVKFLLMLIKLRPEFLSPNADQRIRIFFFINSDQVSEDDVYKMLSFLIVNLKKNHLTYPILIFSHQKDWYIEKDKYLTLKKFYKNIFSTLDKKCGLLFSLMSTGFVELQTRYAYQQFTDSQKKIDHQEQQDQNSFEFEEGKSEME